SGSSNSPLRAPCYDRAVLILLSWLVDRPIGMRQRVEQTTFRNQGKRESPGGFASAIAAAASTRPAPPLQHVSHRRQRWAMRIAVIGMGNVGSALGNRWAGAGQDVTFCVRDPGDARKRADAEKMKSKIGPVSDAAKAEAVLLAVPWTAVPDGLKAAGDLTGKVLLDGTNPVGPELTHSRLGTPRPPARKWSAWFPTPAWS